ncbi:adenylosuccinate synthetase [Actinoplanes sp. NPDC051411]|uniref:adenylosuccinate synthetase n=1 Tax=Actinoplanes sp. NPDC051411 TaxID=3155522 RepID=UPI00343E1A78
MGPSVAEDAAFDLPEAHRGTGEWQGSFRVGHFDAVTHRSAVEVAGGVDGLAVTHLDVPARCPALLVGTSYEVDGRNWERIARLGAVRRRADWAGRSRICPGRRF